MMLKNILNLKGVVELNKTSQKEILGGIRRSKKQCESQSDCSIDQICQNGTCFNCYDPISGSWFC